MILHYNQVVLILLLYCQLSATQNENFATGIANAILGAIFPDLQSPPQTNIQSNFGSNLNLGLPQAQQRFLRPPQGSSPGSSSSREAVLNNPSAIFTKNLLQPRPSQLNDGVNQGNLPPVDFVRGFPPNFAGLTNPEYQNSFLFPSGLQGRTDLPPNYVYPFAQPGSLITPGANSGGDLFSLGQKANSLPVNSLPQSQPQAAPPLDPRYLFTGQPTGLNLNPSLSPFLANLLNISTGSAQPTPSPDSSSQWFSSGLGGDNSKKQIDLNSSNRDRIPLANKKFRSPTASGNGQSAIPRRVELSKSQGLVNPQSSLQLNPSQQQQFVPNQNFPEDSFSSAQLLQPFAASPQLLQQPNQPVQIFNQIFPQGAQLGQLGSAQSGQLGGLPQQQFLQNAGSATVSKKQLVATDSDPDVYGIECPQCFAIDPVKMSGPWVQVYGNPDAMRTIYTTISTLQGLYGDGTLESGTQSVQPVCVGFQFSRPHTLFDKSLQNGLESTLNLYFRDDSSNRQLHEVLGRFRQDPSNPKRVSIKLPGFSVPMCAVKVGPASSTMYSYAILTETIGTNRCQSYHVLARDSDTFFRDYNRNVAEYLKSEVESGRAKPLSVLPYPDLCQLQSSSQILRKT